MTKTTAKKKATAKVLDQAADATAQIVATESAGKPAEAAAPAPAPAPAPAKEPSPQDLFLATRCQLSKQMQADITKRFKAGQFEVKTMTKDIRDKIQAAMALQLKNLKPLWVADYTTAGVDLSETRLVNEITEAFASDPMFKPYENGIGPVQVARVVRKLLNPKAVEVEAVTA